MKKTQEKLLKDIFEGARVTQQRLSHMKVRVEICKEREIPKSVNESVLRSLVEDGHLVAQPLDPLWDKVTFTLTPKGIAAYHCITGGVIR